MVPTAKSCSLALSGLSRSLQGQAVAATGKTATGKRRWNTREMDLTDMMDVTEFGWYLWWTDMTDGCDRWTWRMDVMDVTNMTDVMYGHVRWTWQTDVMDETDVMWLTDGCDRRWGRTWWLIWLIFVRKNDRSGAERSAKGDSRPGPRTKVNAMSKEGISEKKFKVARPFNPVAMEKGMNRIGSWRKT